MAAGSKLVLRFGTTSGEKNFIYNYGNSEASTSSVKAAMNSMIENGSLFRYPPLTKISAKVQIITESEFNISD